jgi:hypothetical protein
VTSVHDCAARLRKLRSLEDLSNVIGTPVGNSSPLAPDWIRPEIGQHWPAIIRPVACQSPDLTRCERDFLGFFALANVADFPIRAGQRRWVCWVRKAAESSGGDPTGTEPGTEQPSANCRLLARARAINRRRGSGEVGHSCEGCRRTHPW